MRLATCATGVLALVGGAVVPVIASPGQWPPPATRCTTPYVRKEWRRLDYRQKDQYIAAVKCLLKKPGTAPIAAVKNRYEDFVAAHQAETDVVHFVGIFYPFHRLLLAEYEKALWSCGWDPKLGQPYWDWTLDARSNATFLASPVFDQARGFGGNGAFIPGNLSHPQIPDFAGGPPFDIPDRSGGGCLSTGPFAGLTTLLGPQNKTSGTTPRCIRRDFSYNSVRDLCSSAAIQAAMAQPNYGAFEFVTDTQTFHPGGHWAVGALYGTMTDTYVSPGDPIFYLHHSNVDRSWWSWQKRDLSRRERDISGPLVFFDYQNQVAGNATLDTPVRFGLTNRVEFKAGDLLNIQKGPFCYTYDTLY